ncbi:4Fe-4S ferredoxin [Candidatus Bathyarchaeota archaeon RBG_16_57_9]|nr:MAG: 4Fe-4S ferredoxin [Candidatus Bathyarchaeota archaeon RBG_16_57_9]OGD55866.1 MAG: 4Fe-4S ferredoxin [Candidatus Bathyarchaeota archaeon RBG_13_60_20]
MGGLLARRKIVQIDEERCDGCGQCIPNCAEGALSIIDGKARLVSDVYCDGLGACLGHCPRDAINIVEREAPEFSEEAVHEYLQTRESQGSTCPSSQTQSLETEGSLASEPQTSSLSNWPVQLNLVSVNAPFFKDADLLLMADCVAVAHRGLHSRLLKGRVMVMGCPKFDDARVYVEKLTEILRRNDVRSLTVAHMEVPCCSSLEGIAELALNASGKTIPTRRLIVSVKGEEAPV